MIHVTSLKPIFFVDDYVTVKNTLHSSIAHSIAALRPQNLTKKPPAFAGGVTCTCYSNSISKFRRSDIASGNENFAFAKVLRSALSSYPVAVLKSVLYSIASSK